MQQRAGWSSGLDLKHLHKGGIGAGRDSSAEGEDGVLLEPIFAMGLSQDSPHGALVCRDKPALTMKATTDTS